MAPGRNINIAMGVVRGLTRDVAADSVDGGMTVDVSDSRLDSIPLPIFAHVDQFMVNNMLTTHLRVDN